MKHYYSNSPLKRLKNSGVLLLSACAMLVSCQQELKGPQAEGEEHLLTFNARVDGSFVSLSRGTSGDVTIENSGFTTIGYMTDGLYSISDATKLPTPNVFNAESSSSSPLKTITRNAATQKYQVELPKIEHKDGSHLSFFAWAQAAGSGGITATTDNASQGGYPWIDVEVALPTRTQRDVVGANTMNLPNEYVVSAVDLDFKHLLSKLSFKIKAPTGATVNIVSTQCSFGADKVYQKGRFTFNGTDTVGVWADRNTYFPSSELTPSDWSTPTLTAGNAVPLGEMLLLPQKVEEGFLSLKVNYTLTVGGVVSEELSRTVSLRANELLQGRNHVYTLLVNADEMSLFNISIAPWIEGETGSLPLVPGPKGDVVLLLDGNEPPYTHTDGKQYWLDASGWNNHCLIDNSRATTHQVTYNQDKKGYVFHSKATGGDLSVYNVVRVPNLGKLGGSYGGTMSCELVAELDSDAPYTYPIPLYFSSDDLSSTIANKRRVLNFECYDKEFTFDFGGTNSTWSTAQRVNFPIYTNRTRKTFYAFTRAEGGRQTITYNDQYHNYEYSANSGNNSALFTNGVIGNHWKGVINYVKITKNQLSESTLKSDYAKLKEEFKINPDAGFIPPPQITRGLLINLDGRQGLQWVNNLYVWRDNSKYLNHARAYGSLSAQPSSKRISLPGNLDSYLRLSKTMGDGSVYSTFTAEFIYESNDTDMRSVLFSFSNAVSGPRALTVDMTYDHYVSIDTPGADRWALHKNYFDDRSYLKRSGGNTFSVTRRSGPAYDEFYTVRVKYNNSQIGGSNIWADNPVNIPMSVCYIGKANESAWTCYGYIYSFRMYDRVLSSEEQTINYNRDKTVYTSLP